MHSDVLVRLERIKELWLELKGTNRTSARYAALVEMVRAESLAGDFDGLHDVDDPHKPASERRRGTPGASSLSASRKSAVTARFRCS
jgi:hypothetical protein